MQNLCKTLKQQYLSQGSGELASGEIRSSCSCQWNAVAELIQRHVLLYVLCELCSKDILTIRTKHQLAI